MSTALGFVPLETYLKSSAYEPDAEYVDGVIEERAMGEFDHGAWQGAIYFWFRQHSREWNIRVITDLRVQVAPTRFRVPDVTVLDRNQPVEQVATRPPVAVFEVLSPEDTVRRLMRKLNDYAGMGIPHIWVVDPETRIFSQFDGEQLVNRTRFKQGDIDFAVARIEECLDR